MTEEEAVTLVNKCLHSGRLCLGNHNTGHRTFFRNIIALNDRKRVKIMPISEILDDL